MSDSSVIPQLFQKVTGLTSGSVYPYTFLDPAVYLQRQKLILNGFLPFLIDIVDQT